jgi:hypothetical protein
MFLLNIENKNSKLSIFFQYSSKIEINVIKSKVLPSRIIININFGKHLLNDCIF